MGETLSKSYSESYERQRVLWQRLGSCIREAKVLKP